MIKSLSPFYINVPFVDVVTGVTCQKYTLKVYVWGGDKDDAPATATYEITKFNPTASTGTDKINIAREVNDFIDFQCTEVTITDLVDGNNQKWVQTEIYYDDLTVPREQTVHLLLRGYGYGMEGENPQIPSNKILIPIQEYKVNREGVFVVPIFVDQPAVSPLTITITAITQIEDDAYAIAFTVSRAINNMTFYHKGVSETVWLSAVATPPFTSPKTYTTIFPLLPGDFDFRISSFDSLTSTIVYSNEFELTVV